MLAATAAEDKNSHERCELARLTELHGRKARAGLFR
jgi:hypothetical protein